MTLIERRNDDATPEFQPDLPEVLIFYANEPDEDQYDRVRQMLQGRHEPPATTLVARVDEDAREFGSLMRDALEAIRSIIAARPAPWGVAVFTNQGAQSGEFEYVPVGGTRFERRPFTVPSFAETAFRANPLSHHAVLSSALEEVAAVFPPGCHEYMLLIVSHGTEELAMTSLLGAKLDARSAEELRAMLRAAQEEGTDGQGS